MPVTVPQGHVALVLFREGDQTFYLQIPFTIIDSLCLRPRKYLLYLGWCVLGSEGTVQQGDFEIGADGNLDDQGIYHYVPNEVLNPARAVDLEVIKTRSDVASESEQAYEGFCTKLLQRDVCCVWTGHNTNLGVGLHIIPYERGSEWFRLVVLNRPRNGENITKLKNINDTRNGLFANLYINRYFDLRRVAVLKTPNSILQTDDIPPRPDRNLHADVSYPTGRYTLQWLEAQDHAVASAIPNNADAAFKKNTRMFKPSDLLLHYNYGAAAVKRWGRGTEILQNRLKGLRPSKPVPGPAGPLRHDRTVTNHKRGAARNRSGASAGNTAGAGMGLVESEGQAKWDEDDVMLFFWGNSKVATERHLKQVGDNAQRIEQWRGGVP